MKNITQQRNQFFDEFRSQFRLFRFFVLTSIIHSSVMFSFHYALFLAVIFANIVCVFVKPFSRFRPAHFDCTLDQRQLSRSCNVSGNSTILFFFDLKQRKCRRQECPSPVSLNSFSSEHHCRSWCLAEPSPLRQSDMDVRCLFPPQTGRCRSFEATFFFDRKGWLCESLLGCGRFGNNFNSREACFTACHDLRPTSTPKRVPPTSSDHIS